MKGWYREENRYHIKGKRVWAVVYQDGDFWRNHVYVTGDGEVDRGEWTCREAAIRNTNSAIARVCAHRRFDPDGPVAPSDVHDDDDDDDGDDD